MARLPGTRRRITTSTGTRLPAVRSAIASPASLTAASARVTLAKRKATTTLGSGADWKAQAWGFRDTVGELRYVDQWISNALSRCTLVGSDVDPASGEPTGHTADIEVQDLVRELAGSPSGRAALLGRLGTYLTIPGEGFVVILQVPEDPDEPDGAQVEEWHVVADTEIKSAGGRTKIVLGDREVEVDDDTATVVRVWRPHPRDARESDSPVRAAIPILREIVRLGQHIEATAKSRLAGAGVLLLPQEITMPMAVDPADPESGMIQRAVQVDEVMTQLMATMSTAVEEPGSAAAIVPIMLQAPGEWLDKVQQVTFSTDFTEVVLKLRDAAIKRLSLALDVPAEVLTGLGGVNHWGSWQIEESAIKLHIEPLLTLICDILTDGIIRPLLRERGREDAESFCLWYDSSGLALKPNKAQDAKDLFAIGQLSGTALRRATGFDETDAPQPNEEQAKRDGMQQVLMGAPTLFADIAPLLGWITPEEGRAIKGQPAAAGDSQAPDPGTQERDVPSTQDQQAAIAVADQTTRALLSRGLELAGKRMRTRTNLSQLQGTQITLTHTVVDQVTQQRATELVAGWEQGHEYLFACVDLLLPSTLDAASWRRSIEATLTAVVHERRLITEVDVRAARPRELRRALR